ncbi:MAG: hypothetical protein CM15mP122_1770 [Bacteroidota bacterium]|nr:MAG: hypothetical protein CM15mP122_1770 [Bacteroidota bacterium]
MVCTPLSCTSIETIETIPNIRDNAGQPANTFLTIVAPATASVTISDDKLQLQLGLEILLIVRNNK